MNIEENIEIAGFKTDIISIQETLETLDKIKNNCCDGCVIQLLNAKGIAGRKHIEHGITHAINAFKRKENLANDLGIEICIRTSAQRQISKALEILGLKEGNMDICVVMINCPDYFLDELSVIFDRDDSVLEKDQLILTELYDISEKELDIFCIEDILIDKTSALIVEM
ncbi:kinase binding protein CGI-121 [Methanobrevibacter cuticularis]|uniref:Kinase binding protein CGI-121 n=1 Tax=Methanobrevibacter cuticularis TaxID=47311 RepID=A0A166E3X3_9EURY|nr:KEOPS complex subunit Cgi121 [Methanobrevibacter cuticularis]KZX16252.1 kinase binding protein CGI-121 [Methanobrevibacter cuticularis]